MFGQNQSEKRNFFKKSPGCDSFQQKTLWKGNTLHSALAVYNQQYNHLLETCQYFFSKKWEPAQNTCKPKQNIGFSLIF